MRYIKDDKKEVIKHSMEDFKRIIVNDEDFYTTDEDFGTIVKIDTDNNFTLINWADDILYWEEFLEKICGYDSDEYTITDTIRYNEKIGITIEKKK